jgi:hypothetical protein
MGVVEREALLRLATEQPFCGSRQSNCNLIVVGVLDASGLRRLARKLCDRGAPTSFAGFLVQLPRRDWAGSALMQLLYS